MVPPAKPGCQVKKELPVSLIGARKLLGLPPWPSPSPWSAPAPGAALAIDDANLAAHQDQGRSRAFGQPLPDSEFALDSCTKRGW